MKQLQQSPSLRSQRIDDDLAESVRRVQQRMVNGDFAGCISSGEALLNSLPESSQARTEVLSFMGTAHGMLQHYEQSYDVFSEAISLDPTTPNFWYNRGLACYFMARPAEALQNFERAVELAKGDRSEEALSTMRLLEETRQEIEEGMEDHEAGITFEQYLALEKRFVQGLNLSREEKWPEAEQVFRELTETGARVPQYWGNLGVSLVMQLRYDEAEAALKQALVISPNYALARNNLKLLPGLRRSKKPIEHTIVNPYRDKNVKQSVALYHKGEEGEISPFAVVEKVGHAVTSVTRERQGKQPPRYDFFLNPYQDTRFMTCPQCKGRTLTRKPSLVISVNPRHVTILDKNARFCQACDLLIVHQDELEKALNAQFMKDKSELIDNDYQVIGTIDREEWDRRERGPLSMERLLEYLHDFKEVVTFSRKPIQR